ncbi:Fungal Zn(2)-Cys(6) transcription factor Ace3-like protein [Penicillium ucsense]|uniref:Fungal Zn(2)-Cys(6) transcription factor Ace3-like protein n=1 Tax=Penicillium ucsense TaxID=2839758 RepID=A0A8J8WJL2_9EURO|nr:Fungal Zn(2)-Cys(6) transcription factor Ace3-like protein [Penicillium ucsense]KAF7738613.1 Fungal Zn(2)-Cys(6) transcription factor Ace3-like protein [Penicillium ucsense]
MAAAVSDVSPRPRPRACDHCRLRKTKCDCSDPSSNCLNCRVAGKQCTFDLPVSRRGPKAKRRGVTTEAQGPSPHSPATPGVRSQRQLPLPRPRFEVSGDSEILEPWGTGPAPSIGLDAGLSPVTAHTASTLLSHSTPSGGAVATIDRWNALARELYQRRSSLVLKDLVNHCFDLFFAYLFPLIPLVHEPSIRYGLSYFTHDETQGPIEPSLSLVSGCGSLKYPELWPDMTFTLITAVCAEVAFLLPKDIFSEGDTVADLFLQASRNCLATYLEADLEYPNANSVVIRYLHSNCMHAAGKPRISWHIFGEATRLAQVLQMHDEGSIKDVLPLEAEFRRRAFWITYIGDKSAAILNNRPITIHKFSFESGITMGYPVGAEDEMVSSPESTNADNLTTRSSFLAGFNANLRIWQLASDLLLEIRLIENRKTPPMVGIHGFSPEDRLRLDQLYVLFVTSLDTLPPNLRDDKLLTNVQENQEGMDGLSRTYTIQGVNLYVTLYCLKMVIAQKFEETQYFLADHNELLLLRKTEVARSMVKFIRDAPFWALQVNGEPCVEKIRLIGASLLGIIDQHETSPLSARAQADLSVLLDILTRLDSKASDTLRRSV